MTVASTTVKEGLEGYRRRWMTPMRELIDEVVVEEGLDETPLKEMIDYQWESGGKRIRALVPLMVAETMDQEPRELVGFGAACELIHNATLVHDDLQDGDRWRRGEPAVWSVYGEARAINLGDAMLYMAPLCLGKVEASEELRWRVSQRMSRYVLEVIAGQEREFALTVEGASWSAYEAMVKGKTSGLMALPVVGAAELCGASGVLLEVLEEMAAELGLLFQIQDDILDLYGEKGRQKVGGDIREGKVSALVVSYLEANPAPREAQRLQACLAAPRDETPQDEVEWARQLFREQGALEKSLDAIEACRQQVAQKGEQLSPEAPQLAALMEGLSEVFLKPISGVNPRSN